MYSSQCTQRSRFKFKFCPRCLTSNVTASSRPEMFVYLVSINWNLALVFDTLPQVAQAKLAYVIQSQPRGKLTFLLYCVTFAILKMHLPHRNTRNHLQTSKLSFPKHFIKFWCISRPFQKFPIHFFISEGANLAWYYISSERYCNAACLTYQYLLYT